MAVGNHTLPGELLHNCSDGIIYCSSKWAYNVTSGFYWTAMLIGFVVALIMATQKFGTARAFGFGTTVGMLASIWFATLQLIPWYTTTIFIIVGLIGIVGMIMSNN